MLREKLGGLMLFQPPHIDISLSFGLKITNHRVQISHSCNWL